MSGDFEVAIEEGHAGPRGHRPLRCTDLTAMQRQKAKGKIECFLGLCLIKNPPRFAFCLLNFEFSFEADGFETVSDYRWRNMGEALVRPGTLRTLVAQANRGRRDPIRPSAAVKKTLSHRHKSLQHRDGSAERHGASLR